DQLDAITIRYFRRRFPDCARAATRLATVSEYSREDIANICRIPSENISVISNAARDVFTPLPPDRQAAIRSLRTGGAPYFVFVGVIQPRKNLTTVLQAFDRFKQDHGTPHKLVIAGRHGWRYGDVTTVLEAMTHKADVVFTGYLSDEELASTVGAATALTMVPHFEGFGIPILEAMACGTPVITSNVTSLPEVAGDAALFVPPTDIHALASAMSRITHEPTLAHDLSVRGLARSRTYSWDRSADQLWDLAMSAR
ncbi:MAG: glycosyltransferase family 1 protein, partial [Ignavibacteriae bacterium]